MSTRPVRCVISPTRRRDGVVDDQEVVVGVERQLVGIERPLGGGAGFDELLGEHAACRERREAARGETQETAPVKIHGGQSALGSSR